MSCYSSSQQCTYRHSVWFSNILTSFHKTGVSSRMMLCQSRWAYRERTSTPHLPRDSNMEFVQFLPKTHLETEWYCEYIFTPPSRVAIQTNPQPQHLKNDSVAGKPRLSSYYMSKNTAKILGLSIASEAPPHPNPSTLPSLLCPKN